MKTITITQHNAIKAHKGADDKTKKVLEDLCGIDTFVKLPIMERINTFEDVLEDQGITLADFEEMTKHDDEDDKSNKAIKLIAKCLNEGPLDPTKTWYYPVFNRDKGAGFGLADSSFDGWNTFSIVGERRCYKSSELALFAGRKFAQYYKPFILDLSIN